MALDDIDDFREQLPDAFENRTLPPNWEEDWFVVPLPNPEKPQLIEDVEIGWDQTSAPRDWGFSGAPDASVSAAPVFPDRFPGSPAPDFSTLYPPPDALAFYLPFHYFHPDWWGIYLTVEGTEQLRDIIREETNGALTPDEAMFAARLLLYGHEAYHHAIEVFATRLEVTHRRPLYREGFEEIYRSNLGTDLAVEEALANAAGMRKALGGFGRQKAKQQALRRALLTYFDGCPPGYREAYQFEKFAAFKEQERAFAEANHSIALNVPLMSEKIWAVFPFAFSGISRITSRVHYIVPEASPLAARLRLGLRYLRKRDIERILGGLGCVKSRDRGPHEKWRTRNGRSISVPRHREIPNDTARSILKDAGLTGRLEDMLQLA